MSSKLVTLRVWGDFACFTRPEMKVERVSYPVMTPSAARGILEAIFWEPQMYYLVDAIRIVKRGNWIALRRNEITKTIDLRAYARLNPVQAGGGAEDGTQRNMLALREVEYLITAEIRLTPLASPGRDSISKYGAELERRAGQGKCFHRPGLGMREFAADFDWEADADATLRRRCQELGASPENFNEDLGLMLYDLFDHRERQQGFRWLPAPSPSIRSQPWEGRRIVPSPAFFRARVQNSVLDCHPERVKVLTRDAATVQPS